LPRGTVVEPMAAYNASPSAIKTLTSTCEIGTRSLKCAVRCPRGSLLKAPAPSGPAPDEPFLITIARAGRLCAIVNAASQPQRNHPAHPVPSPGRGFMSFVPGPETVRAAESEAGQLQGGARCAPIPSSIVGGGRWSSDRASHARASGSRGSREQEHSGTSIWRLRAPPAAAHGRPGLGEPRRRAAQRCSAVQCSAGLMQVTAVDRGGNRASAHPVLGHFSEARGRGEDGEDPHCPHSGCSLWCETAYYRLSCRC
jgi:hypothetical protein